MTRNTKKKTKRKHSPITRATLVNKHREVRDVFNKLRKKYKLEVVYDFFRKHYFLQPEGVDRIITHVDKEPINEEYQSLQYRQAMNENFYL